MPFFVSVTECARTHVHTPPVIEDTAASVESVLLLWA